MKEKILYENQFFEYIEQEKKYCIHEEEKTVNLKFMRRPPGVRALIINSKNQILLSYEYRYDLECFDYRLPGGKVFDTLEEYRKSREEDTVMEHANASVCKEVKEEVGIDVKNPEILWVSKAGASIHWDLYYYLITDFEITSSPTLEENEVIDGYVWKSFEEVKQMCLEHRIHEERTVGVLLSYILKSR